MTCSQLNKRKQPLFFLETTIQIERVVGLPERKESINIKPKMFMIF